MDERDHIDLKDIAPAEVAEIDLYQRREKIYTRKIEGFYQKLRLYTGWPLLIGYFIAPWLSWNDRQMILFDLPARKFHILGITFWPQDFPLLAFLLIIAAFALFTVTTLAGRIWCGYTCPQTVWTSIFMWLEQKTEGSRLQRVKLDQKPWSWGKIRKKSMKHLSWLYVAYATGFTFVGYFYPVRELLVDLWSFNLALMPLSWIVFFTLATYINAGWMREQVCMYMCPYARFQSVMFDHDTLIVSYDATRGEPRGSRKRDADASAQGLGDCINCELCIQVCPTGIDIRDGLQYQCIGCALCIDACDSVMDKMQYPRGLVRYSSENALSGQKTRWLRPRIIGYALVLAAMIGLFSIQVFGRVPIELTALRDRTQLYITTSDGAIENLYTLQLANKDETTHKFVITIPDFEEATIIGPTDHIIEAGEIKSINLRLRVQPELLSKANTQFVFHAQVQDSTTLKVDAESRFLRPL